MARTPIYALFLVVAITSFAGCLWEPEPFQCADGWTVDWSEVNDGKADCEVIVEGSWDGVSFEREETDEDERYIHPVAIPFFVSFLILTFLFTWVEGWGESHRSDVFPIYRPEGEAFFLVRIMKLTFSNIVIPYVLASIIWVVVGSIFWPVSARGEILYIYPYEQLQTDTSQFILAAIALISLLEVLWRKRLVHVERKKMVRLLEDGKRRKREEWDRRRKARENLRRKALNDALKAEKEFRGIGLPPDLKSIGVDDISWDQKDKIELWVMKYSKNSVLDTVFIKTNDDSWIPHFESLKVEQLKDLLREKGLSVAGNKIDLKDRLEKQNKDDYGPQGGLKSISLHTIKGELERLVGKLSQAEEGLTRDRLQALERDIIGDFKDNEDRLSEVKRYLSINETEAATLRKLGKMESEYSAKQAFLKSTALVKSKNADDAKRETKIFVDCSVIMREAAQKVADAQGKLVGQLPYEFDIPAPASFYGPSDYRKGLVDAKSIISKVAAEVRKYTDISTSATEDAREAKERSAEALVMVQKAVSDIKKAQASDDKKRKKSEEEEKKIEQEESYFRNRFGYVKFSLSEWKDIQKQERSKRQNELPGLLKSGFASYLLVAYLTGQIDKRTLLHLKQMESLSENNEIDNHRLIAVVLLYEHNRAVRLSGCEPIPMPDNLSDGLTRSSKGKLYFSEAGEFDDYDFFVDKWVVNEEQMKIMVPDLDKLDEPWERIKIHFEALVKMEESLYEITTHIGKLEQIHEFKVIHDLSRTKDIGVEERKLLSGFVANEIPIETIYRYVVDLELTKGENLNALSRILNGEDEEAVLFEVGLWQD